MSLSRPEIHGLFSFHLLLSREGEKNEPYSRERKRGRVEYLLLRLLREMLRVKYLSRTLGLRLCVYMYIYVYTFAFVGH